MNVSDIPKVFAGFIRRFHTILFFLAVSGGLSVAILILMATVAKSSEAAPDSSKSISGIFDEKTIDAIQQSSTAQGKPGTRQSPFIE